MDTDSVLEGYDLNYLTTGDTIQVRQCRSCRIGFTLPTLSPSALPRLYPSSYHAWTVQGGVPGRFKGHLATIFNLASGNSPYCELFFPSVLSIARYGVPGRVLEVGCGTGELLSAFQRSGWEACGIEPNLGAARLARERGLTVDNASLETIDLPMSRFNAIILHHALEHLSEVDRAVSKLAAALRPGGRLYVGVPDFDSKWMDFFGSSWSLLDLPRHRFHFDRDSLKGVVESHNLTTVEVTGMVSIDSVLESLLNLRTRRLLSLGADHATLDNLPRARSFAKQILGPLLTAIFARPLRLLSSRSATSLALIAERQSG